MLTTPLSARSRYLVTGERRANCCFMPNHVHDIPGEVRAVLPPPCCPRHREVYMFMYGDNLQRPSLSRG